MPRIFDISLAIGPDMLVWPGDSPVRLEATARLADGDPADVSELRLSTHTGTHVDPPGHFLPGGATVEQLPLEVLIGEAVVADLTGEPGPLGPAELDRLTLPDGTVRLLLKTANSSLWHRPGPLTFPPDYVALSAEGAEWVVERGIRLLGTDFLSIEAYDAPGHPTHVRLLEAGVVIVEGLDLAAVEPGRYTLTCLPLKVAGGDGAPARAVLVEQ
jgi:arylformamidase